MQGARSIKPSTLEAVITWERLRNGRSGVTAGQCRKMYEFMSVGKGFSRGHKLLPKLDKDEEDITIEILQHRGGLILDNTLLWFDALDKVTHSEVAYIRAALRRKENLHAPPRIRLSTIHGMKGGEANEVILLTDMAARTMNEARKNPDDEARVWYVAVTRAREALHIVAPKTQRFYHI
jgi:superfamily I DNA/RNA helicase